MYLCSRFEKRNICNLIKSIFNILTIIFYSQITIKKFIIMKTTVFELNYCTSNNEWHNVLFANKNHAQTNLEKFYQIGAHVAGQLVIKSFIIERILF